MPERAPETTEEHVRAQLQRGLRTVVLVVAVVTLWGLCLPNLLRYREMYHSLTAQTAAFATLSTVLLVALAPLTGRASGERLVLPAACAVHLASLVSYAARPLDDTASYVDWAYGSAVWVGLAVLLDRPLRVQIAFLTSHWLIAAVQLTVDSGWDVDRTVGLRFLTGSVGAVGYPLCVAVAGGALHRIAKVTATAGREAERIRTQEAVALASHRYRQQRLAALHESALPVLQGLADGTLDPQDAAVQRRCAIEAAQMRRTFAEADAVPDPLMHELRHCADVADRKGVVVELDTCGRWPNLSLPVRRDLTDAALRVLASAGSQARVTVVGDSTSVSVNVVADCEEIDLPSPRAPGTSLETLYTENLLWMEARWKATESQR